MAIQTTISELNAGDSVDSRIPIHWKQKFADDVFHLVQEKGSKLIDLFKKKSLSGAESVRIDFFEQRTAKRRLIGRNTANNARNTPVEYSTQQMGSVTVYANAIYDAELFDKFDVMRQNHDQMSEVKKASAMAIGRDVDAVIIEAFKGYQALTPSNSTNANGVVNNWPSYLGAIASTDGVFGGPSPSAPTAIADLSVEVLIQIKSHMLTNQVVQEGETIHLICRTKDLMALLRDPKLPSSDYNTVKALVNGEVDYYMGINFIRIDHSTAAPVKWQADYQAALGAADPADATSVAVKADGYLAAATGGEFDVVIDNANPALIEAVGLVAFVAPSATCSGSLAIGMEMELTTKFDIIPQTFHSTQYLAEISFGASRLDPKATLQVLVKK